MNFSFIKLFSGNEQLKPNIVINIKKQNLERDQFIKEMIPVRAKVKCQHEYCNHEACCLLHAIWRKSSFKF